MTRSIQRGLAEHRRPSDTGSGFRHTLPSRLALRGSRWRVGPPPWAVSHADPGPGPE